MSPVARGRLSRFIKASMAQTFLKQSFSKEKNYKLKHIVVKDFNYLTVLNT